MTTGTIRAITPDWSGDTLAAATSAASAVIVVEKTIDFDEDGGWLTIADSTPMRYLSVDDEAKTVTLAAPAGAVYAAGEPVREWDPTVAPAGANVVEYRATVELDNGSPSVLIPHEKIPLSGVEKIIGASVSVVEAETPGQWEIGTVFGREAVVDQGYVDTPFATLYQAGNVSYADSASWSVLDDWTVDAQEGFTYDAATGELTFLTGGLYALSAAVRWAGNTSGRRYIQIVTDLGGTLRTIGAAPPDGGVFSQQITILGYRITPGEKVTVEAHQTSGAALDMQGDTGGRFVVFQAVRVQA